MAEESYGLYVHIPFCRSRCRYCAFVSKTFDQNLAALYLKALLTELRARRVSEMPVSTIFIGGGTPSTLSPLQLRELLSALPRGNVSEMTVEMNPESTSEEKLSILRDGGVTRISFGVQTFSKKGLKLLGRPHDPETAAACVEKTKMLGFSSVSLDLISGWPGQTRAVFLDDLGMAVDLGARHVSCYELTLHPESELAEMMRRNNLRVQTDAEAREFWDAGEEFLRRSGFMHYETSNYSFPGHQCRHNLDIWKGGEYMGVGVAAHSHVQGVRSWNTDDVETYVVDMAEGRSAVVGSEKLDPPKKARETAVFWLRLAEGIEEGEFVARTGYALEKLYADELPGLLAAGVLEWRGGGRRLALTRRSYPVADAVFADLV